jgi:hypothetical protein
MPPPMVAVLPEMMQLLTVSVLLPKLTITRFKGGICGWYRKAAKVT